MSVPGGGGGVSRLKGGITELDVSWTEENIPDSSFEYWGGGGGVSARSTVSRPLTQTLMSVVAHGSLLSLLVDCCVASGV